MRIKFRQGYQGPAGSFSPGDVVDLEKNKAIDICNAGLAFPAKEKQIERQINEYPKHTGGGWYELSNGDKVRSKENAIKEEKLIESG